MDITPLDITIIVASTVGIILMSFAFPALGLGGEEAEASEIPEMDVQTDRFDMAGDFPQRPSSPDGGTLRYVGNGQGDTAVWLDGDGSDGELLNMGNDGNQSDPQMLVILADWDNDNVTNSVEVLLNETGDDAVLMEGDNWEVYVRLDRVYDVGEPGVTMVMSYDVRESGGDGGGSWYSGVPVIGDTAEGVEFVAEIVYYLAQVVLWGILTFVEFLWNMAFVIFSMAQFAFGMLNFLTSTYAAVSTAGNVAPWASVILLIPGVMLGVELMKLAAVLVSLVWIG